MMKMIKNKIVMFVLLSSFFTHAMQGMARLRILSKSAMQGVRALKQQARFKNVQSEIAQRSMMPPIKGNNILNELSSPLNYGGYKNSYSKPSDLNISDTKNFLGSLLVIFSSKKADDERLSSYFVEIKNLLQEKKVEEADAYCKSIWFPSSSFALETLELMIGSKASNVFFGHDGEGHRLFDALPSESKEVFAERILKQAIETETFEGLGWDNRNYRGCTLLNTLSQEKKDEMVFPLLEEALKTRKLQDLGWNKSRDENCFGVSLFAVLSQEKKEKFVLAMVQEIVDLKILPGIEQNRDNRYEHVLLEFLPYEKQQEIILHVIKKSVETNTLQQLEWTNKDSFGLKLFNTLSQKNQSDIAFSVFEKALETDSLQKLGWSNDYAFGKRLFKSLKPEDKNKIVIPFLLKKAEETKTFLDLWRCGDGEGFGLILFNGLTLLEREQISLCMLKNAWETNTLPDLGWSHYSCGDILLHGLWYERERMSCYILKEACKTNTLQNLGWGKDSCGNALLCVISGCQKKEIVSYILQKTFREKTLKNLGWGDDNECGRALLKAIAPEKLLHDDAPEILKMKKKQQKRNDEIIMSILQEAFKLGEFEGLGWSEGQCGRALLDALSPEKQAEIMAPLMGKALKTNFLNSLGLH